VPGASPVSARADGAAEALLLRHAPTSWNDRRRRQGWDDQPLTAAGRSAARTWARGPDLEFAAVVASDLQRARETAEIIAAELGLGDVVTLAGLREQDQGAWTGLTKEQIKRRWPDRLRERPRRPVGGEPPEVLLRRVLATLASIAAAHERSCVLAITHSDVIRTLERAIGVEAPPVPHLEGRWFRLLSPVERECAPSARSVLAGELTAQRREIARELGADRSIAERR
jgi:uncharacterized phosphatase